LHWERGEQFLTIKDHHVTKCSTGPWTYADSLEQPRQQKMGMRFETWNVRSMYRESSLKTVSSKLAKYKLDLAAV